jgi:PPM family protein phosphatase
MNIKPTQWWSFSEIGGRNYQEDYLLPQISESVGVPPRYFIVCDGMGGHSSGQVASRLSAEAIAAFLEAESPVYLTAAIGQQAVSAAKKRLATYVQEEDPFASGLGTTAAFIYQNADGSLSAVHCGDSRIYHFRKGRCLWHSTDHSYVHTLVADGTITAEEALTHRSRNVLMRSINAGQQSNTKADTHIITDITAADVILICSDGVYDPLPVPVMEDYLKRFTNISDFTEALRQAGEAKNGDNYTAWVVQFGISASEPANTENAALLPTSEMVETKTGNKNNNGLLWILVIIILLLLLNILRHV